MAVGDERAGIAIGEINQERPVAAAKSRSLALFALARRRPANDAGNCDKRQNANRHFCPLAGRKQWGPARVLRVAAAAAIRAAPEALFEFSDSSACGAANNTTDHESQRDSSFVTTSIQSAYAQAPVQ